MIFQSSLRCFTPNSTKLTTPYYYQGNLPEHIIVSDWLYWGRCLRNTAESRRKRVEDLTHMLGMREITANQVTCYRQTSNSQSDHLLLYHLLHTHLKQPIRLLVIDKPQAANQITCYIQTSNSQSDHLLQTNFKQKLDDSAFFRTQCYITEICYFEFLPSLFFG